jgi:transposase
MALRNLSIKHYPGTHSVWILDGASIHCDPGIVNYLRALGVIVLFLPAYCPFFNPIEIMFGLVKKKMQRFYVENGNGELLTFVGNVMR